MIIDFIPTKLNPWAWLPTNIDGVVLKPGDNELTKTDYNKIKDTPLYQKYDMAGCFVISDDSSSKSTKTDTKEDTKTTSSKK